MKNIYRVLKLYLIILLVVLIFLLFFGCTTPKKIQTEIKEMQKINEVITETVKSRKTVSVDTSRISTLETNTESVDFFNPGEVDNYAVILQLMRDRNEPYSEYGIVKSVTKTSGKAKETQSGVSQEKSDTQADRKKENNTEIKKEEKTVVKTEPFFAKYKWYLIAASAIIIGIGVFFIAKKVNLKKFFSWAK